VNLQSARGKWPDELIKVV
jgi:hypothetical protein